MAYPCRLYPLRRRWAFNRIIEFSGVNNSHMPHTLTLLHRLDDDFTLNLYSGSPAGILTSCGKEKKKKKKTNAFSYVSDIFTKVTLCLDTSFSQGKITLPHCNIKWWIDVLTKRYKL